MTNAPTPSAPQYARARTASKHFNISESTLWLWAKTRPGFPQPLKAGPRTTLFEINAIDAFLKATAA